MNPFQIVRFTSSCITILHDNICSESKHILPCNPELNLCYQVCPLFAKVVQQILCCALILSVYCNMFATYVTKKSNYPSSINNDLIFCTLKFTPYKCTSVMKTLILLPSKTSYLLLT